MPTATFSAAPEALEQSLFEDAIAGINPADYQDAKLVIKGCGDKPVPTFAYVAIMQTPAARGRQHHVRRAVQHRAPL